MLVSGSVLVDESMLTGESLPLSKSAPEVFDGRVYDPLVMKKNSLFCGALCKSSKSHSSSGDEADVGAKAVVMRTGMHSSKGMLRLIVTLSSNCSCSNRAVGILMQALLLPAKFQPPYAHEASFFLFLMFLYSLWNFAATQRLVQVR
jgi:magnesium-transporting ATPase (P-type)